MIVYSLQVVLVLLNSLTIVYLIYGFTKKFAGLNSF